jgi:hypothetical protein
VAPASSPNRHKSVQNSHRAAPSSSAVAPSVRTGGPGARDGSRYVRSVCESSRSERDSARDNTSCPREALGGLQRLVGMKRGDQSATSPEGDGSPSAPRLLSAHTTQPSLILMTPTEQALIGARLAASQSMATVDSLVSDTESVHRSRGYLRICGSDNEVGQHRRCSLKTSRPRRTRGAWTVGVGWSRTRRQSRTINLPRKDQRAVLKVRTAPSRARRLRSENLGERMRSH